MKAEPFEGTLARREPSTWMMGLASLPLVGALGALLYAAVTHVPTFVIAPHLTIFGILAMTWVLRRKPLARYVDTRVSASLEALRLGELTVTRQSIKRALYVPAHGAQRPMVRVERRGLHLPIEIAVTDEAEGRRLLSAMGHDASQAVARFRAMSLFFTQQRRMALGMFAMIPAMMLMLRVIPHVAAVVPFAILLFALVAVVPAAVEVGTDGLLVKWLGTRRFIPTRDIMAVWQYDEGMGRNHVVGAKITLKNGQEVKIPIGQVRWADDNAASLVERIREAVESHRQGDVESAAAMLARGAAPVGEWIRLLKSIGAGANATLRTAAVDAERLWKVLESPSAAPNDRAAAAVALSAATEEGTKERIRIAADAIAEPKLRVAVQAAASEDEAALEQALEEVEASSARESA